LAELSFEKGKSHNLSLVIKLRALLLTLKYGKELEIDTAECIFRLGILLKRSRFFTFAYSNQQLLKEVQDAVRDRSAIK